MKEQKPQPHKQYQVQPKQFDAYPKDVPLQDALGSRRHKGKLEAADLRSVNYEPGVGGWRLTPTGIELGNPSQTFPFQDSASVDLSFPDANGLKATTIGLSGSYATGDGRILTFTNGLLTAVAISSMSPSQSPSASASPSSSQSPSASPSTSPSASQSPSASISPSSSPSQSPSTSESPSSSPSQSPSSSSSPSASASPSISPSQSPSASISPSFSPSQSPSTSVSPSVSPSISPSISPSP